MDKNILISKYDLTEFHHNTIYSSGTDFYFNRPCIGYIKNGYAEFLYQGKTIYAYEHDLIYIAYETRYQSIWHGFPEIDWYSASFDFNSKYAFYNYRFQIVRNYPHYIFDKMFETYKNEPLLSLSYFYQLLNNIYNKMECTTITSAYSTIEAAIKYIEENYQEHFPTKKLADICHISESGFFKLFKKATGVTPIMYKHNIMIQHAISLLSNTSMSIEEISTSSGFVSSNYFRKVFFELTGKTPKELRQK